MSVELTNDQGAEFQFSNHAWFLLMNYAAAQGFRWPLDDNGDDNEELTDHESAALADAIERGVGNAPASDVAERISRELTERLVTPSTSPMFRNEPIEVQARTVEYWKQFISFARQGGFSAAY